MKLNLLALYLVGSIFALETQENAVSSSEATQAIPTPIQDVNQDQSSPPQVQGKTLGLAIPIIHGAIKAVDSILGLDYPYYHKDKDKDSGYGNGYSQGFGAGYNAGYGAGYYPYYGYYGNGYGGYYGNGYGGYYGSGHGGYYKA